MNITCKFETIRRISHTISLSGAVGIRMTHMAQEWTDFSPCGVGYTIVQQGCLSYSCV